MNESFQRGPRGVCRSLRGILVATQRPKRLGPSPYSIFRRGTDRLPAPLAAIFTIWVFAAPELYLSRAIELRRVGLAIRWGIRPSGAAPTLFGPGHNNGGHLPTNYRYVNCLFLSSCKDKRGFISCVAKHRLTDISTVLFDRHQSRQTCCLVPDLHQHSPARQRRRIVDSRFADQNRSSIIMCVG